MTYFCSFSDLANNQLSLLHPDYHHSPTPKSKGWWEVFDMRCGLVQYVLLVLQISWWGIDYACYVPYATLVAGMHRKTERQGKGNAYSFCFWNRLKKKTKQQVLEKKNHIITVVLILHEFLVLYTRFASQKSSSGFNQRQSHKTMFKQIYLTLCAWYILEKFWINWIFANLVVFQIFSKWFQFKLVSFCKANNFVMQILTP